MTNSNTEADAWLEAAIWHVLTECEVTCKDALKLTRALIRVASTYGATAYGRSDDPLTTAERRAELHQAKGRT